MKDYWDEDGLLRFENVSWDNIVLLLSQFKSLVFLLGMPEIKSRIPFSNKIDAPNLKILTSFVPNID